MKAFVFTCGDINGIGPEIVVKTINKFPPNRNRKIIFICPKNVFESTIQIVRPKFKFCFTKEIPSSHNFKDVIIPWLSRNAVSIEIDAPVHIILIFADIYMLWK